MEKYSVIAISLTSQSEIRLTIEADEAETTADIILSLCFDGDIISATNEGYFQAFQEIRDKLLNKGYGLKCVGSMLNTVQSPMASATDKVYKVTLGIQAKQKDLVSLYEYVDIKEFPNTDQQNRFAKTWFHSL
jgi:hypothetical protein